MQPLDWFARRGFATTSDIRMAGMNGVRYGDLVFEESFVFARRGEEELRFTRQERALLILFTRHPRQLLRRSQILDALNYVGSDSSDRNVDFLVNRLRQKLNDNARAPRFIATQYGEGYLWIAVAESLE
ncbi:winged helix-turn-helix domain-containing protein [Rhizobiaceae bacterium n13]|uniref:Winged helix-turn-helix domain-containing protein n=1 Tax=Ferirhizobium litorale TaxID=2927786 RepID=A0AAE3Q8C8_9HYPH|nr:winged helix-turn-helix domain-containing protein [Fererhizobium litorale]MDI7860980.1 winged helix-turn-helix domain-containing protein [Fererhizobium litorale]MDI7921127.1 winged helix-turn-helix domain-containing protein [Fererhizobium litorale]